MKRFCWIGILVLLALVACNHSTQVPEPVAAETNQSIEQAPEPVEGPSQELSAIDSLMWHQPDSALARLIPYFDTCATTEHNRHYANLLLSELLYKTITPRPTVPPCC